MDIPNVQQPARKPNAKPSPIYTILPVGSWNYYNHVVLPWRFTTWLHFHLHHTYPSLAVLKDWSKTHRSQYRNLQGLHKQLLFWTHMVEVHRQNHEVSPCQKKGGERWEMIDDDQIQPSILVTIFPCLVIAARFVHDSWGATVMKVDWSKNGTVQAFPFGTNPSDERRFSIHKTLKIPSSGDF